MQASFAVLASCLAAAPTHPAMAAEEGSTPEQTIQLPPVEVPPPTLFLPDQRPFGGDISQRRLTTEEQVRFLPDALRTAPGIGLQRTGPGQTSPFLRGFTGFRTQMVLDGFRLNHSAWRDGPNQYLATVDAEAVEQLHFRLGSGGFRYGMDGIGGTLLIDTIPAGPYLPDRDHTALTAIRLASAEESFVGRVSVGGQTPGGRLAYHAGTTLRDFGDLEGGQTLGRQRNTGYQAQSQDVKLRWLLGADSELIFGQQRERQDDVPRTHRTQASRSWRGTTTGTDLRRDLDQERDMTFVRLHWREAPQVDAVHMGATYHSQEESRIRIRSDGRRDEQSFDVDTFGLFVHVEEETALGLLRIGGDHYHDNVNSWREDFTAAGVSQGRRIQGAVGDDADYRLTGVFIESEAPLWSGATLFGSGRYGFARADADSVLDPATGSRTAIDRRFHGLTGGLTLQQEWRPRQVSFVSVVRTVRMPNLSDLTRFDSNRSSEIETPSSGLDEESFVTLEVGQKAATGPVTAEVSAYTTWIRDQIVRFPTGRVVDGESEVQKANAGKGFLYGVDLWVRCQVRTCWAVIASVSHVAGHVDDFAAPGIKDREPISRLPPLHGYVQLRYDHPDERFWAEGEMLVADEQDRLSARDELDTDRIPPGGTPGYTVLSLRAGTRIGQRGTLSAAIENLLNKDYRLHGSGVNEPGTNLILSLRWIW